MTENEIRAKVAATAKKYLGCKESDGGHRQFIDAYNGFKPLPRNHRMTYSAAWCATFVSAIAIECGLTEIIPVECGCSLMIGLYKKLGRWREDENYIPKVGDIIFYDWDDGLNTSELWLACRAALSPSSRATRAEPSAFVTSGSTGVTFAASVCPITLNLQRRKSSPRQSPNAPMPSRGSI